MRKAANVLFVILLLYVIGFFIMHAIAIKATESQIHVLRIGAHKITNLLYNSWIEKLEESNPIKISWRSNGKFWCNKIDSCDFVNDSRYNSRELDVTINSGDIYEYKIGQLGDEQGLEIRRQAEDFEVSEIIWGESGINPTYRYKPKEGFYGKDSILIYILEENLEDEGLKPYVRERIRIGINVSR